MAGQLEMERWFKVVRLEEIQETRSSVFSRQDLAYFATAEKNYSV